MQEKVGERDGGSVRWTTDTATRELRGRSLAREAASREKRIRPAACGFADEWCISR
jgi:hypothetical protein